MNSFVIVTNTQTVDQMLLTSINHPKQNVPEVKITIFTK